jgi:hypothetical protein
MRLECETSFYNDEKLDGDLTHAQETADEAKEIAEQAGGTATNYLYESVEKGLVVSRTKVETDTEVEALTAPNSRVTATGFDVYKDGTTQVAHFGESTYLGAPGTPQLRLESDNLTFTSSGSSPVFHIYNDVTGESSNEKILELDGEYLNTDGTLNSSALATIISNALDGETIMSAEGDHVLSTDGAYLTLELTGYGFVDNESTNYMTASTEFDYPLILGNESVYATFGEIASSTWSTLISDFVALFPAGTINYYARANLVLTYNIVDVAMTLGNRVELQPWGARSVSFGNNNVASGTGAVTIGRKLKAVDDYSLIVGENNPDIEDSLGNHMPTAFAIGANGTTPFAVLKNGIMVMSAVNSGKSPQQQLAANTATDIRIDFEHEYPNTPFIFLTLNEDNVPQSAVSDYGSTQIYLKMADTTGFTATVVNGGTKAHTFSFSWFAISIM